MKKSGKDLSIYKRAKGESAYVKVFSIYVKVYVYVTGTLEYMLGNHVLVVASHECMPYVCSGSNTSLSRQTTKQFVH